MTQPGGGMVRDVAARIGRSPPVRGFRRCYSIDGRIGHVHMLLVTAAAFAVLWLCSYGDWQYGRAVAMATGAVAGAAIAAFVTAAVRRLRDAAIDRHRAAWTMLALAFAFLVAVWLSIGGEQQVGDMLATVLGWSTPTIMIVALLWPTARRPVAQSRPAGPRGPRFALACILGGLLTALFLADISIGMHENTQRRLEREAREATR